MSISVIDVSCSRGNRTILDEVTLEARPGNVLALVGPNGAGKSTLLAIMTGDLPVISGTVHLDDRPLEDWRPREMAQRRAVLLQDNEVAFAFTSRQIVEMGRAPWPADPDVDAMLVEDALERVDVGHLAERPFRTLSGGERARVSLARVLAQATPIVLLDEPTAALDLQHQEGVMKTARALAAQGRALVVVLHDLSLAAAYADDVAVLSKGSLAAYGPPREVLTPELIHQVYDIQVHILESPDGRLVVVPAQAADVPPTTASPTARRGS